VDAQAAGSKAAVVGSTRVLAISGSLRAQSSNTAVLRAVALLAPPDVEVEVFGELDALPHFNPDHDVAGIAPPPSVLDFRRRVDAAGGLILCSPEYAHGVPGTLKNALDWLVSAPEAFAKPVGLLNASPRAWHAQASLAETLRTMWMHLVVEASITLPARGRNLDDEDLARDPELAAALRGALDALVHAARARTCLSYDHGRSPVWGSATMLQLRPNCEWCDRNLPPDSPLALICSFECTFCRDCADTWFGGKCPNCGGELVARPRPPKDTLGGPSPSCTHVDGPAGRARPSW